MQIDTQRLDRTGADAAPVDAAAPAPERGTEGGPADPEKALGRANGGGKDGGGKDGGGAGPPEAVGAKADADDEAVPEAYGDFTLPEGFDPDTELADEFKAWAKDMEMTQTEAQAAADLGTKMVQRTLAKQQTAWNDTIEGWQQAARNDADYGGDTFDENLSKAKGVLKKFGSEKLKQDLDAYGFANHPELIRVFVNIGNYLNPGEADTGTPRPEPKSMVERWYGQSKED